MNIKIIGTGSTGNSILFDNTILLDVGLPYKKIEDYTKNIKAVLLTHHHADHFNVSTVRKIHIENTGIKFCCGDFMHEKLLNMGLPDNNIVILKSGELYRKAGVIFSPVNLYHDCPNFGYRLIKDDYKHFHATDTNHLEGITAKNYDSATIECNHHRQTALKIIEEKYINGQFCHLSRAIDTHLDVEQAIEFIMQNNIKKLIPVHMGSSTIRQVNKYLKEYNNKQA